MRWAGGRWTEERSIDGRRGLSASDVPFAPTDPGSVSAGSLPRRALEWTQRFRTPVGVAFNVLIIGAAFFAYTASRDTGPESKLDDSTASGPATAETPALAGANELNRPEPGTPSSTTATTSPTPGSLPPGLGQPLSPAANRGATPRSTTESSASTNLGAPPDTAVSGGNSTTRAPAILTTSSAVTSTAVTSTGAAPSTATRAAPSTVRSTTTRAANAFIGDRVRSSDGDGLEGVTVSLFSTDAGVDPGRSIATDSTDDDGYYGFNAAPGCYAVSFNIPAGATVAAGSTRQTMCVSSGERYDSADVTVTVVAPVEAPPACDVQIGRTRYAGVEIRDPNRAWAAGYVFYGSSGNVVVRTANLGPPDDTTNPDRNQIEWTSHRYGFEESDVYAVAAEDADGNVSAATTCSRRRV